VGLFDRISGAGDRLVGVNDLRTVDPALLASDLKGPAQVVSIEPTGISFGIGADADPVIQLALEVRLADRSPYPITYQQRVPHLSIPSIQPGATVTVCVDPANAQRLTIDFDAPPAAPQPADDDALGKLERLARLHEQGVITDAELAEQKRKLLDAM
jgi:Short C-terminal domain